MTPWSTAQCCASLLTISDRDAPADRPAPPIVTIDFEASCLPAHGRSFPIEVGIAHADGRSRSWLIRPTLRWSGWDWSDEAQGLHGLSRQTLYREGQSAAIVLAELAQAVEGCRVVADSPLDADWLALLAQGARRAVPFAIEPVEAMIDELGAEPDDVAFATFLIAREGFVRHRAGDDARWLARFVGTLGAIVQHNERVAARQGRRTAG